MLSADLIDLGAAERFEGEPAQPSASRRLEETASVTHAKSPEPVELLQGAEKGLQSRGGLRKGRIWHIAK